MVSPAKEKLTLLANKLLIYPGMEDNGLLKKGAVFGAQIYLIVMTIIAWLLDLPPLYNYGISLLIIGVLATMTYNFSQRGNLGWVVYAGMLASVLITLYYMINLGGVLHSAGLVFIGPVIIILSLTFQRKDWTFWLMAVFITTLILTAIFGGKATATMPLPEGYNLLFFTLNAVFLGIYILVLINNLFARYHEAIEAQSKKGDEVRFLLRSKTKLYSDISDKFNDQLAGIINQSQEAVNLPESQSHDMLLKIQQESLNMVKTLNTIKDLSELESGTVKIRKIQSDFIKFSQKVTDEFNQQAKNSGVTILYKAGINQFNFDFDPKQLVRIFSYLLADSIRRTPPGGQITVAINKEQENTWKDLVEISISNTGSVLEKKLSELIFTSDYEGIAQAKAMTAPGLMMAGELIRKLDGKIYVRSKDKKGTKFSILFPAHNTSRFISIKTLLDELEISPLHLQLNGKQPVNSEDDRLSAEKVLITRMN